MRTMQEDQGSIHTNGAGIPAVIYVRVSSREQEREGYSINAQLKLLREYAVANGFQVTEEIVDVETAKQSGRVGFERMVDLFSIPTAGDRSCNVLLVEKTDRLYRNLKDWVTMDELDLDVHLVKENVVLTPDARSAEKFMHGIKVLMAKNYIDNLGEEIKKGMQQKAEQGYFPSFAPLGYNNVDGPDGKRIIEPDPDAAPVIRQIYEWYATGDRSIKDVAGMARDAGLVFRKSGRPVNTKTVHNILHNRTYTGDFDWSGKTYKGVHDPLVSVELWERVQDTLTTRLGGRRKKVKHDLAYANIITCGHCGCAVVGEIKKQKYVYYRCTHYKGKCPEPYVREEVLDGCFAEALQRLVFDNEVLEWIRSALHESLADKKKEHDDSVARLQRQYQILQGRLDGMYADKLDGVIDLEFYERKKAEWSIEQRRLLESIEAYQQGNEAYMDEGVRVLELAQRAEELFFTQAPTEKRRLLSCLLSNSTWKDGQLHVEYRQPFDLIAVANSETTNANTDLEVQIGENENWRSGRDSNPRWACDPYSLSRRAPSASSATAPRHKKATLRCVKCQANPVSD